MRAFVTGATGFLGGRVAAKLRERGDEVVCLIRDPAKASELQALGCELVPGDLRDVTALRSGMEGCHGLFHMAADFRVGIPTSEHAAMQDANVGGTERVFDAAAANKLGKIVYVSTIGAFGNTSGRVVDEAYEHPGQSFTSEYERTKWRAHRIAQDRINGGLPIVIVQPGGVYGPGDRSLVGQQLEQASRGKLPMLSFGSVGLNLAHVDDIVDGILLAYDKGRPGQSYVLGGEITTLRQAVEIAASVNGKQPPRLNVPPAVTKAMAPLAPLVTRLMRLPPNYKELVSSADGVTFWATDAKAREELGYAPRDLRTGLRQVFGSG